MLLAHPVGNGPVHRDNLSLVSLLPVSVSGKVICHDCFPRALIKKNGTQKMPVRISLKLAISASRSEVSGLPW